MATKSKTPRPRTKKTTVTTKKTAAPKRATAARAEKPAKKAKPTTAKTSATTKAAKAPQAAKTAKVAKPVKAAKKATKPVKTPKSAPAKTKKTAPKVKKTPAPQKVAPAAKKKVAKPSAAKKAAKAVPVVSVSKGKKVAEAPVAIPQATPTAAKKTDYMAQIISFARDAGIYVAKAQLAPGKWMMQVDALAADGTKFRQRIGICHCSQRIICIHKYIRTCFRILRYLTRCRRFICTTVTARDIKLVVISDITFHPRRGSEIFAHGRPR